MNSYEWPFGTQEVKCELRLNMKERRIRAYKKKLLSVRFYHV